MRDAESNQQMNQTHHSTYAQELSMLTESTPAFECTAGSKIMTHHHRKQIIDNNNLMLVIRSGKSVQFDNVPSKCYHGQILQQQQKFPLLK